MYALCGAIGGLLAGWLFCRLLVKRGQDDNDGIFVLLFVGLGIVLGSHLLYGLINIQYWGLIFKVSSARELFSLLALLFGGGVFYGGLIGGLVCSLLYIKRKKLDAVVFSDCGAVCIPLFHAFARAGCFFAGCCYGIESEWGFASAANPYVPEVVGVQRFPTQLLEASLNLLLFAVLFSLRNKKVLRGRMLCVYLMSYSVIRFFVEFLRGDAVRGIWLGVSTSQWISCGLFLLSTSFLLVSLRKKRTTA